MAYKMGSKSKRPTAKPEMLGTGAAARAGSALRDRRQQQMRELGLKDGGLAGRRGSGGIKMPPRTVPPRAPMPAPQRGETPKRVRTRPRRYADGGKAHSPLSYRDGGKVVKSVTNC